MITCDRCGDRATHAAIAIQVVSKIDPNIEDSDMAIIPKGVFKNVDLCNDCKRHHDKLIKDFLLPIPRPA